jgi:hypothetical protein
MTMANGFDDLVEQLLYDVALTGSKGTAPDLFTLACAVTRVGMRRMSS